MDAVLDTGSSDDTGIPKGAELLAFVDAAETDIDRIDETRDALSSAVGDDGVLEAAGTIAAFNGLIRVADGTGIQLDDGLKAASANDRAQQGINNYAGAASTPGIDPVPQDQARITRIQELFG